MVWLLDTDHLSLLLRNYPQVTQQIERHSPANLPKIRVVACDNSGIERQGDRGNPQVLRSYPQFLFEKCFIADKSCWGKIQDVKLLQIIQCVS